MRPERRYKKTKDGRQCSPAPCCNRSAGTKKPKCGRCPSLRLMHSVRQDIQHSRSVTYLDDIEFRFVAGSFPVLTVESSLEFRNCVFLYDTDCTSAESGARDTGAQDSRDLQCEIDQKIDLVTGDFVVIAQGFVRSSHEGSEPGQVVGAECGHSLDRALALIHRMTGTPREGLIHDDVLHAVELVDGQSAETVDVHDSLDLFQCSLAFAVPGLDRRSDESMLDHTVRYDDAVVTEFQRRVLAGVTLGVEQNRIFCSSHGTGELISDAAFGSRIVTLGVICVESNVFICKLIESVYFAEHKSCEYFKGSGRGESGERRYIASDDDVAAHRHFVTVPLEGPHDAFHIIGPAAVYELLKIVEGVLADAGAFEVYGIKAEFSVGALSDNSVRAERNGAREVIAPIIVCVVTHQIDTTR